MRLFLVLFLVIVSVSACTTERVSTEFGALSKALDGASNRVSPKLRPGLEADRQAEITAAARNGDAWFLSDDCNYALSADVSVPGVDCYVEKVVVGDRAPVGGHATDVARKLSALNEYVAALDLLMSAGSDAEISDSYALALTALGGLNKRVKSDGLAKFLRDRHKNKPKLDGITSPTIAALRYKRMRSVVLASNADVTEIVREIQLKMILLGLEPEFELRAASLSRVNEDLLLMDPAADPAAYRAALVNLEFEHAGFMRHYRKTAIYDVGMIGRVHDTLAQALRSQGGRDDIINYLRALKDMAQKVKG